MRPVLAFILSIASCAVHADAQITLNPIPTRVVGQDSLTISTRNPNLVEGREFDNPGGIALDMSTNPPGLYVADTSNNRVLGFRSAVGFANGQAADVVLGQPDPMTTLSAGPGTTRTTGMSFPTGVAVDASGNVYVTDAGNNRILRFPTPFTQGGTPLPDLVIGQAGFSTGAANQGGISAATLALTSTSGGATSVLLSYLALDAGGNLWATDPGNNRVLRYNVRLLGSQPSPGPAADIVLGQQDFVSNGYTARANPLQSLTSFTTPTGIAFDSGGRLFVTESVTTQRGRILVWNPPFSSGQSASRLLGVDTSTTDPPISPQQLNVSPSGLFAVGDAIGVADTINNRILIYPPFAQWTSDTLNQTAVQVVGQKDFFSGSLNQGQPGSGAATLARPIAAAFSGTELYVADSANNRMVAMPQISGGFGPATRVLGQDAMDRNAPNLIEGREFNFIAGGDAGVAVDLNSSPPHLYVADTYNNRILGFKDLRNLQPGAKADIVIGQVDFYHGWANYPSNDPSKPNQASLSSPTGLYVDPNGNLYVADTGNSRVLRFPTPFVNYQAGVAEPADLVLGQLSFTSTITDATARTMAAPYGLAQASEHGLLVSDVAHCRVLFFPGTSATFTSGESATLVFGQKNFTSAGAGTGLDRLSSPHHIATDSDDRLYVADTGNGRIAIFDHAPSATTDPLAAATLTTGLATPRGMYVSPVNGDIWVSDIGTNTAIRFPAYNSLETTNFASNATLQEFAPFALTEDGWGNIFIADAANRVVIHYPGLSAENAANYIYANAVAPGMIAALYSTGNYQQFGQTTASATAVPLPTTLAGLQVLFNGAPCPLFFVSPLQINFQIPMGATTGTTADLQVLEVATGRLLGDTTLSVATAVPGIFTQAANGSGAAIAANEDGTLNTQTNPAVAGHYITLYGTGQGFVAGAPPDGNVSTTALPSARPPTVIIEASVITGPDVQYAGLAPGLVGVWQVNVKIPSTTITLPTAPTPVVVIQDSVPSANAQLGRVVQIYVKQP